jgi:hypothetical protein
MARFWFGVICLLFAAICAWLAFGVGIARLFPGTPPVSPMLPLFLAIAFGFAGLGFWVAELRATSGDDPLAGRRGLLIAMMLMASVAILALLIAAFVDQDMWRGMVEGLNG